LHKENCLSAIAANKHVLCEKPMTINAAESEVVIKAARDKGVFLMEGEFVLSFEMLPSLKFAATNQAFSPQRSGSASSP